MKIVILVRILWSAGAQRIAIKEAKELHQSGHDVKLIFLRRGKTWGVYSRLLQDVDYEVISEGNSSIFSGLYSFMTGLFMPDRRGEGRVDYDLLRKFPEIVKKLNPDKIICHDEWAGYAGFLSKRKYGIPYEVYLHERLGSLDVPLIGKIALRLRDRILRNAEKVYSVTQKIASDTNMRFGYNVVSNPPGFDRLKSLPSNERRNSVASIAMWDANRDPYFFIQLEKYLHGYEIDLVGNWRDESYYENFKKNLPEGTFLLLKRGISEAKKEEIISKSKYLVRFGKREFGLATAVIESISSGTPVIINEELGTADMIRESGAGYVLDSAEPELAAKLILETSQEKYDQMVKNTLKLRDTLTWTDHAKKLVSSCN